MGDSLRIAHRPVDFAQQLLGGFVIGQFFPVHHAEHGVDRLVIGGIGQQDAAIEHGDPMQVHELRFETDRRLIRENLQVMVGDAAEQRAARHVRKLRNARVDTAFAGEHRTKEGDGGILDTLGEIQQHAVRPEIG